MANVLGESGRYVSDQVQLKRWHKVRLAFIVIAIAATLEGFLLATIFPGPPLPIWSRLVIMLACAVVIPILFNSMDRRLKQLDKELDAFHRGEDGETTVARALARFPDEFYVINDLSTPFGNLDHVVVGPTGVFLLDTKSWRGVVAPDGKGELLVNGQPTDRSYIRSFVGRALGLRDRVRLLAPGLDPFYQAVFVFTAARVEAPWGTTGNLHCIRDEQLHDYIVDKKFGQKLRPEDTRTIAQAFLGLAHMDRDFTAKFAAPSAAPPPPTPPTPPPMPRPAPIVEDTCLQCGVPVEPKVVSFCRLKRKQLGGRILCRACQRPFLATI
jgi:hypothetical protein